MPFSRSAYNLKSRLHISHIPMLRGWCRRFAYRGACGRSGGFRVFFGEKAPTFEVVASEDAEGSFEAKEGTDASEEGQAALSSEPSQRSGADQDSAVLPTLAVHVSGAVASPGAQ